MDLGTSLEQQQGFEPSSSSAMRAEAHELPGLPERKSKKNPFGAIVNVMFTVIDFVVMVGGLCTLTVFVLTEKSVQNGQSSRCILFASYNTRTESEPFKFGEGSICAYVIWSMAAVSIFGALYLCGFCSRILCSLSFGMSTFNCLSFFDFIANAIFTLMSITVALIIRIGHNDTCDAIKQAYPESISDSVTNCSGPFIVNDKGNEVLFSNNLYVAEMMAWTVAIILLLITLAHLVLLIGYFRKCCGSRRKGIQDDDEGIEQSPFRPPTRHVKENDDDDEPLLDPSSDAWNSNVEEDHTSFPPYNLGSDQHSNTGFHSEDNYFPTTS